MKKIQLLVITFDQEISGIEISKFRGAIIKKVGEENILFHNHKKELELSYQYPLIQYKTISGKATLVCLNDGTKEISNFFSKRNWNITLGDREVELSIDGINARNFYIGVSEKKFQYRIINWLPLNKQNYQSYTKIDSPTRQIDFLENILTGNLISFSKGIELNIKEKIQTRIIEIETIKPLHHKGTKLIGVTAKFESNFFIPNYIGLGKSVSHGFGIVKQINTELNGKEN